MAKRRKPAKTKSRRSTRGVSSRKPGQDKGRILSGPRKERLKTKLGRISRNHKRRSILVPSACSMAPCVKRQSKLSCATRSC